MKTTNVVQAVVGNVGVSDDALEMSIDVDSSVFLMDALGKLYAQPARAALREYLSNAVDAHVEAGGKLPAIEIKLPGTKNRILSIRDYGQGMSEDNFNKILRRYGASTKRHSNKLTGGFGLGAKAGFALTDSFHMTSYQNGARIKVRIFKNAEGKGFIEVIERTSTHESDGVLVEVEVPLGNLEELSYKSIVEDKFFAAYSSAEITVTAMDKSNAWSSASPTIARDVPIDETSLHNSENYSALEYGGAVIGWVGKKTARSSSQIRAIIGRVAYDVKHDAKSSVYSYASADVYSEKFGPEIAALDAFNREVILNLPIGSVDLPSAREEITYSERSLKTLTAVASSVHRIISEDIQREINAETEASKAMCKITALGSENYWKAGELTWKGKAIPLDKDGKSFIGSKKMFRVSKTNVSRGSLTVGLLTTHYPMQVRGFFTNENVKSVHITVKDADEAAVAVPKVKSNITDYFKLNGGNTNVQVFVVTEDEPNAFWFEHGEKMTLPEFIEVGKKYRSEKRAEAKALAQAQSGNPAFKAGKVTAATREVFSLSLNTTLGRDGISLTSSVESSILDNATDYYYLSKAEVKDVCDELSNLFPTRAGNGGTTAYIDNSYAAILPTLKAILGEDKKLVFLPATRNMDEFKSYYPNVRSVVEVLRDSLNAEWKDVKNGTRKVTYLADIFWLSTGRSRVSHINQFWSHLTAGERVSLNSDLQELHLYMNSTVRNPNPRLHLLISQLISHDLRTEIVDWISVKIEAVSKRYPLLTMMSAVGGNWEELKSEMIRYLKTC